MSRSELVVKNLLRNRRRTLLTVASVGASISLLVVFHATYRYISAPPTPQGMDIVLMVAPRTSLMVPLPGSYKEHIAKLPGVAAVSPVNMVDIEYHRDTTLWLVASDPETILKVRPDWRLSEDQHQAFVREKVALIAGRKIAQKLGWKIGDPLTLRSEGYNVTLELVLRGTYTSSEDETLLSFHWEYLNDAQGHQNKPGAFWVLAREAEDVPKLMHDIDTLFRNSAMETRTQPMRQFVLDFLAMLGNVKLILLSVSAAVVFAMLLIVANTMGMTIRERTAELAVLRALGFQTRQVLGLLTAESLAISLAGAAAGCLIAWGLFRMAAGYQVGGGMPVYIRIGAPTLAVALATAVGISFVSTLVPAYRASRTSIAQALRFVG
jgi:putative ABC transport system permease protein